MNSYYDNYQTPIGNMEITASNTAVEAIDFVETLHPVRSNAVTDLVKQQMLEYFDGNRQTFDLPLGAQGTDFQQQVWQALCGIDFGHTCSYSDIANKINNPKAVRAVGAANGRNPLTIVVPCHRVVGMNGSLTGYASGVERKAWLLNHEAPSLF